jgi:hypothetical protein
MPFPDSQYPSVLRGYDRRQSERLLNAAPHLLMALGRMREIFEQLSDGDWRELDATYVDQLIESDGLHGCDIALAKAKGK